MKWLSGRAVSVRMLVFCIGVLCLGAAGVSRAQDNLSISPEPLTYVFQAPGPLVVTNWMSRTGSTNVDVLVTAASSNNAIVMVTPVNILAGSASNTIVFLIFGTGTTHIGASAPGYNATNWLVRVVGVSPSITVTPTNLLMNVGGVYTARLVRVDATNNMINPVTVELRSADTSIFQVASAYTNLVLPGVAGNVQTNDVVLSGTGVGVTNLIVSAAGYATDSNTVVTVLGAATQVHSYAVDPFPIPITGGGTAVVTITRTAFPVGSLTNDVTFTLTSSATNVFGVLPASVVMLGTNTASQSGSVVLSGFISGTGTLGIVSSDPLKYPATNVAVSVTSGVWQITYTPAPLNVYTGRTVDLGITRFGVTSNALSHSVTAYLASADAARFTVLPTVAVFTATSGLSQSVTGLAVRGVSGGTAQLRVTYSDSRYASTNLAVNVMTVAGLRMPPAMVVFTNEARVFDVVRAGDTNVPLVVNLAAGLASGFKLMGDSGVYSYSDVLTIPAGQASAAFRVRGESIAIVNILVATVPSLGLTTTGSVFVVTQVGDSDADNLPDWWELLYFTNLAQNASGDYDNDGLSNLTELRCYPSTDPTDSDTDHNNVSDYDEDFDDDWLTNGQEQDQGDTRPDRKDTDDDGYTDLDEMFVVSTDPLDSFSPYSVKALRFSSSGVGMVTVSGSVDGQETAAYGVSEFVVECWVKPAVLPGSGVTNYLVTKYAQTGNRTNVNYQLGLRDGGKPFVRYQYGPTVAQAYVAVGATEALKVGRWTHIAGQYLDGRLTIYVDGQNKASLTSQLVPPAGKGKLVFGGMGSDGKGFVGDMKELRIWRGERTADEIAGNMDRNLFYDPQSVDPGVLQVVGGQSHLRESATTTNSAGVSVDHLTEWTLDCWVQIDPASGPGILMGRLNTSPPVQDDTDMNYYLKLDAGGRLVGGFASEWTRRVIESQPGLVSTNFDSVVLTGASNELRGALGVQDGKWHHVAYVRNGRETLIYVDGQLDSKQPNLIAPPDYSVTVAGGLGGTLGTISYHFSSGQVRMRSGPMLMGYGVLAKMDEVRVWNRGLTPREIKNQMKANLSGNEDGLVSYFNFDYQQGALANERAAIRNTSEEYGLYVQGAARVFGSVSPGDSSVVFTLYPFKVLSGLALLGYFAADDGGSSVEDFIYQLDWDHAGVLNSFVSFVPVTGSDSPIRADSDGDGLPDWWESMNGLDPRVAAGSSEGANGDLDNDGLCNLYEYFAGTDPQGQDTDLDGILDYDDTRNNGSRSWGELYDDGDRIPDRWEVLYSGIAPTTGKRGLDPHFFDADLDPDQDGWSNYAEYMGYYVSSSDVVRSSNPLDPASFPQPLVSMRVRYSGKLGTSIEPLLADSKVYLAFYRTPAMDGFPDAIAEMSVAVTNTRVFASGHLREGANYVLGFLDVNGNGIWDTVSEPGGLAQSQPVMIGWEGANEDVNYIEIGLTDGLSGYPRFGWEALPGVEGYTLKYMGDAEAPLINRWVSMRNGVHEGDYLYAMNQPGSAFTSYGLGPGTYNCQIYTNMVYFGAVVSSDGFHRVEIIMVGALGVSVPRSLTGHDAVLPYARNEITCAIDQNATWAALEIGTNSTVTPVLAAVTNACVFRDPNGYVRFTLPFYAGDSFYTASASAPIRKWANGRYWVRIVADNPGPEAPVSTNIAFNLDLRTPAVGGKSMLSGKVRYFGKVAHGYVDSAAGVGAAAQASNLNIIVQSYMSEGFCGNPDAQVEVVYTCTNAGTYAGDWWEKGTYQLMGLHRGVHYVRAFIDLNGNRALDRFEPVGFAQTPLGGTDYEPRAVDLSGSGSKSESSINIVIRDRDTDDDQLPDGWEWMYFGTLTKGAYDYVTKRTLDAELQGTNYLQKFGTNYSFLAEGNWYGLTNVVYTGSSLQFFTNLSSAAGATVTLLWNYEIEPVDVDPTRDDYDGDGLGDIFEVTYSDIVAGRPGDLGSYDPYDPVTNPNGKDLNPARVDTDGDGLSDGLEIKFGFDPINPNGDRDGDGVSDADELMRVLTNPQERQDALGVLSVGVPARGSGAFNVQWLGKPGVTYCVQYSVDLLSWTDAVGGTRVGAGLHSFVDLESRGSRRYYRIVVK